MAFTTNMKLKRNYSIFNYDISHATSENVCVFVVVISVTSVFSFSFIFIEDRTGYDMT